MAYNDAAEYYTTENALFHPNAPFKILWDSLTFVVLIMNALYIPCYILIMDQEEQRSRRLFMMCSDIWFIVDIWISFNTGFTTNRDGESIIDASDVNMDRVEARQNYVKGWFLVDIISTLPFDLIMDFLEIQGQRYQKTRMLFRGTKMFKLARTAKVFNSINQLQYMLRLNYHFDEINNMVNTIKKFILMTILCMVLGSSQYGFCFLYSEESFKKSWIYLQGLHSNDGYHNKNSAHSSIFERSTLAFFRAFSQMFCIGYGQISPRCVQDAIVVCACMITGAMFFAIIIATVTAILQNREMCKQEFNAQIMQLKEFTSFKKFPADMKNRLTEYFEVRFEKRLFDEQKIMSELNPLLRRRLWSHKGKDLIQGIEFLGKAEDEFLLALVVKLKLEVYLQGDQIVNQGDVADCMFFIRQGTVTVQIENTALEFKLKDGCFFGESCLIAPGSVARQANVHAESNLHVFRLTISDFQDVLSEYPRTQKKIREWQEFIQEFRRQTMDRKKSRRETARPGVLRREF